MTTSREPYSTPTLIRHGTLAELTAVAAKGTQSTTDQQSTPATE